MIRRMNLHNYSGTLAACRLLLGVTRAKEATPPEPRRNLPVALIWAHIHAPMNVRRVAEDSPDREILAAEYADLHRRYANAYEGIVIRPVRSSTLQIRTAALDRFFPQHRFYFYSWDERQTEGEFVAGLAIAVERVLAIGPDREVSRLTESPNYEAFAELLARNGVRISSSEEARLVWLAFCDAFQRPWHSRDLLQVSDREWHLGIQETEPRDGVEPFRRFYRVLLDADQKVLSASMRREAVAGP